MYSREHLIFPLLWAKLKFDFEPIMLNVDFINKNCIIFSNIFLIFFFFTFQNTSTHVECCIRIDELVISNEDGNLHCVKSVGIWSCSGPYFSAFGLNTKRYSHLSAFSSNEGKCRPE